MQRIECIGLITAICFLIKVRQNIIRDQADALRGEKRLFTIDVPDFLVVNIRLSLHCLDVLHSERQHIFVVDGVYNGIRMKLIAERLLCCAQGRILTHARIDRKDGCTGKSEQMVLLKILGDCLMHIAELTAMALVKDNNYPLIKYGMPCILFDKSRKLLNRSDNDPCIVVFQLTPQNRRRSITVCSALFKSVVFLYRLVVKILAVYDEKHLIYVIQLCGKLRRLERSQRFAAAGGMPDVPAARSAAVFLVVVGYSDAV